MDYGREMIMKGELNDKEMNTNAELKINAQWLNSLNKVIDTYM